MMSPRNSVTPVLNLSCWILRYSHANSVEYLEAWLCRTSKPLSAFARIAVKHQGALALPRKGAWGGAGVSVGTLWPQPYISRGGRIRQTRGSHIYTFARYVSKRLPASRYSTLSDHRPIYRPKDVLCGL